MIERRRYMGGEVLPYDAEVEYLESTGLQYIELNHGFYKTDEVICNAAALFTETDKFVVAPKVWNNSTNRFAMVGCFISKYAVAYGSKGTQTNYSSINNDQDFHIWHYKNYEFWIEDVAYSVDVSSYTFGSETDKLRLFYGYNTTSIGRIKSYSHKKDGVLVYDLIPVRVGQVGYMYDKVSKQLFDNSGTGDFVLGPDK